MTAALLVVLWLVPVVAAAVAVERLARARRTRAQMIDALAVVPELAGTVPPGTAERAGVLAEALARRLGLDPQRTSAAARLHGVAPEVVTDSGIAADISKIVREGANAPRGGAVGSAAAVRVAWDVARQTGDDASLSSGVLFRAVVDHASGDERRAAEALVHLVQEDASSA